MSAISIIDSHVHLWNPEKINYPWLATIPVLNKKHELEEYLATTNTIPIESILFVEADCHPQHKKNEIEAIIQLAKNSSFIQGIISGENIPSTPKNNLIKSMRWILQHRPNDFCLQEHFVDAIQKLADEQLCFDLCIIAEQLPMVTRLVAQCPKTRFVLDHLGKPAIRQKQLHPWQEDIKKIAQFPNVYCKISGLVTEADHLHWTINDLKPYVLHALDVFGEDRILFGSDWPVVNLAGGVLRWFEAITEIFHDQSHITQQKFFRENALNCYTR